MAETETLRVQLLKATLPFILAAREVQGVKRIALMGSLTTTKINPKDVDLLITVEDAADLEPLATLGRKLGGRITSQTHGNYGADLFIASPRHHYLGRLCKHRDCPGYRMSCEAMHCGLRPYLRDDLRNVTLERSLVIAPPLETWPTIIAHVQIPADVEQTLLVPLIEQLGLQRMEQLIPRSGRSYLIKTTGGGAVDQIALAALHEAATFLDVQLSEDVPCNLIEMRPLDRYASMIHFPELPLPLSRLWIVELAGKTCFVAQSIRGKKVVSIAV